MKLKIRKSLFIILGALVFGTMPSVANAADFDFGSATKSDNVVRIPVIMEVGSGENIKQAKIGCETNHTDVSCEVESANPSETAVLEDSTGLTFQFAGTSSEYFPTGNITLATLVVTNSSTARITSLTVSLHNSSIEGVSKSASINTDIGARVPEREPSSDATLSGITVSQGTMSPSFSSNTFEYTVYNIADTINSVRITPVCNDGETCSYTISGGRSTSGSTVTLNQGENTVNILVESENGQNQNTYTLTIYRGETAFNSDKLASLSFGDYTLTPAFTKDVTDYTLTVPNTVNSLSQIIKYELEDTNATIDVKGLDNLVVGTNTVTLTIDNVNGDSTTTYTIRVTRLSEENIEILKYIDGEVTFRDADGIQTTLSISEFENQYPAEYEKIMNDEYQFDEEGNIIVESTEPVEEKEEEKSNNRTWLIVILVIVGLIIIVVSGILIFRKKKPKKGEEKNSEAENAENNNTEEASETSTEEATNEDEEINEEGIEESIIGEGFSDDIDKTVDVDIALNDLMSTKQYEFKDKDF